MCLCLELIPKLRDGRSRISIDSGTPVKGFVPIIIDNITNGQRFEITSEPRIYIHSKYITGLERSESITRAHCSKDQ